MTDQEEPRGNDLTGQVTILSQPGMSYRLVIGAGGFATVYKGEWRPSENENDPHIEVAVKIFRTIPNTASDSMIKARRRLIRETIAWLPLSHRNIQPYFGHCSGFAPSVALISPFCRNGTIMEYIKNWSADTRLRLKFVTDIVNGLAYLQLHKPVVVHGDLKPNNILIDNAGNALLADFGRAKLVGESGFTTDLCAGSAPYMAPELLPQTEEADVTYVNLTRRSDMYAFAISAFEIITEEIQHKALREAQITRLVHQGVRPLRASDTQKRISDVMWEILQKCWDHEPARRPLAPDVLRRMFNVVI